MSRQYPSTQDIQAGAGGRESAQSYSNPHCNYNPYSGQNSQPGKQPFTGFAQPFNIQPQPFNVPPQSYSNPRSAMFPPKRSDEPAQNSSSRVTTPSLSQNSTWRLPVLPRATDNQNAKFQKLLDSLPDKLDAIDRVPDHRVYICSKGEYRPDQEQVLCDLASQYGYDYLIVRSRDNSPNQICFASTPQAMVWNDPPRE